MKPAALAALVTMLSLAGCVVAIPRVRPAHWPESTSVTAENLRGRFTGTPPEMAMTAGVFFASNELWGPSTGVDGSGRGPNLRRNVSGLGFDLREDRLAVRVEFDDGNFVFREVPLARERDKLVLERRRIGREGGSAAGYRDIWRLSPDVAGGLVFEHIATSAGHVGLLPGAYYERRWWRLQRSDVQK